MPKHNFFKGLQRATWNILIHFIQTKGLVTIGAMGTGGLTAWATATSDFFYIYGRAGWLGAGIIGALIFVLGYYVYSVSSFYLLHFYILKTGNKNCSNINPLDSTFNKTRIDIKIFSPLLPSETITEKNFTDCELFGPAVICFLDQTYVIENSFRECDFVKLSENCPPIKNVTAFSKTTFKGCKFYKMTILVPSSSSNMFNELGVNWIA